MNTDHRRVEATMKTNERNIAPSMQSAMAFVLVPVHKMILAPPRASRAADGFSATESM